VTLWISQFFDCTVTSLVAKDGVQEVAVKLEVVLQKVVRS
jgi:hypothetical protein